MKRPWSLLLVGAAGLAGFGLGAARKGLYSSYPSSAAPGESHVSAESLPALTGTSDDRLAKVLQALFTPGSFRDLARLGSLLHELPPDQMKLVMERADRLPTEQRAIWLPRLFTYWMNEDQVAATAWFMPKLERLGKGATYLGSFSSSVDPQLLAIWARTAPERAYTYVREHPASSVSRHLLDSALSFWPDKDPSHRFQLICSLPEAARQQTLPSFLGNWAETDQSAALAAARSLPPGPARDELVLSLLLKTSSLQPQELFREITQLGTPRIGTLALTVEKAATLDPTATLDWWQKQDAAVQGQLGATLAAAWAQKDPAAALAWALAHGVDPLASPLSSLEIGGEAAGLHGSHDLYRSPFRKALEEQPDATLQWIRSLPPEERERYLEAASTQGLMPEPEKLLSLLGELPPEAAAAGAERIFGNLMLRDPVSARSLAETLPAGPVRQQAWASLAVRREEPLPDLAEADREAMLSGIASQHYWSTPAQSLELANSIRDEQLRWKTIDSIFWSLNHGSIQLSRGASRPAPSPATVAAAQAWLRSAPLPEGWKQDWRR